MTDYSQKIYDIYDNLEDYNPTKILDIDFLFTNIPLYENINICIDILYKDDKNALKIPKYLFRNLPNFVILL